MSRLFAANAISIAFLALSPAAAEPVLEGTWTSDSGAVIACSSFRCDKILPGNGTVIDTFDYRLNAGALELRSLASGRVHHYTLSIADDGALVGRSALADSLRLEPYAGPAPYQNYVPFPGAEVQARLIELEAEPLRPGSPETDALTASR
ncbi:MAG: hypothetical protein AAF371_08045 [Pseudomonadota bacterium]